MRLLLDSCVSKAACLYLRAARAAAEKRALVTIDKDFGDLAIRQGRGHAGIVRLVGFRASEQGGAADSVVSSHRAELARGCLLTAERDRLRIRER